jgi:serine/threonine protein kinase
VGTGTFGRVRLVVHKPSDAIYALKILKKSEVRVWEEGRAHAYLDSAA